MKKLVILFVMVLACQMGSAQGVSDLFNKYAKAHNAESVNVSSLLIKFARLFADDDDAKALKGINSVKILDLDDETFEEVEGDADSLAGLLLEIKGDFPELNEKIDYQNFTFAVTELDEHRISKIKVIIHEKSEE